MVDHCGRDTEFDLRLTPWQSAFVANESRLDLVDGRRRQPLASCVSAVPLTWLAMYRLPDLVVSRSLRFTTDWTSALARLRDPRGLQSMFLSYGDISQHTSMVADTLVDHVRARGTIQAATRVSVDVSEIAGEHSAPREWARALGSALDALDDPAVTAAPTDPLTTAVGGMTEIDKIRQVRSSDEMGIGEARALLRAHGGDLHAALGAIEAGKGPEQRARDKAGAFTARLVNHRSLPQWPPWQVLFEASGLDYGLPFPAAGLLLQPSPVAESDLRTHTRLVGESVASGAVSWEPDYRRD